MRVYGFLIVIFLIGCEAATDRQTTDDRLTDRAQSVDYVIPPEVLPVLTVDNVKPEYRDLFADVDDGLPVARAAYRVGIPLDTGTYTYYFQDCDYSRQQYTELQIQYYEKITKDIHFVKGESWESSDIRIICADSLGYTSFAGKDIFKLDSTHWTTSLGKEYYPAYVQYATQHELYGHLFCGLDHEHHNRKGRAIDWNRDVLDASFKKRFGWDSDRVTQWINRQQVGYISTDFNPSSFMMYVYDCSFTNDGFGCGQFNYLPSKVDIETFWSLHGNGLKP